MHHVCRSQGGNEQMSGASNCCLMHLHLLWCCIGHTPQALFHSLTGLFGADACGRARLHASSQSPQTSEAVTLLPRYMFVPRAVVVVVVVLMVVVVEVVVVVAVVLAGGWVGGCVGGCAAWQEATLVLTLIEDSGQVH